MRKFWTAVIGVSMLGSAMSLLFTVEATMQDNNLTEIAQGNMAEIMAGNLALERSQNEQVRQFAQQMVADHTAAGTELQTLATSKNFTLPAAVTDKQKSDMDKLGARSGADFDREFMKMMVKDHERMEKLLSREAERNPDADVKAFAAKTLTAVQGHLTMARSLNDSLRGTGNGGGNNNTRGTNTNRRSNTNDNSEMNMNMGTNGNSNSNADNTGFSNLRPNVNPNANTNTGNRNSGMNRNSNTNRNRNTNGNTNGNMNGNANNTNVNRM